MEHLATVVNSTGRYPRRCSHPPPLAADDADGHVVHNHLADQGRRCGTRVGAIAARGPALARLRAARVVEDFFVPAALQEGAVELLGAPGRLVLPAGGLHGRVALDPGEDDVAVAERAYRAGVRVFHGHPWFAGEPPAPFCASPSPPSRPTEGVRRLAAARAE